MSLFSPSVPINQFLFGGDTSKRLEEIEKTNKVEILRLWFNKVHTQGSVTSRVVAQTNLEAVASDLRLSDKALPSILFLGKRPSPYGNPYQKPQKGGGKSKETKP